MVVDPLRRAVVLLLCLVAMAHGANAALAEQRLADGLSLLKANRPLEALPLLEACLADFEGADRKREVYRLIGHLYHDQSKTCDSHEERLRLMDKASERYLLAGDDADVMARRHYLANECAISAERGYRAGWKFIAWNGLGAIDGWLAVFGNYGATMTCGKGIPGLIDQHPMHAVAWGAIIALLLLFAVIGFLRKPQVPLPPPPLPPEPPPERIRTPQPALQQRTPQPIRRPSATDNPLPRRPSSGNQPAPAMRNVKPAIPVPAAGSRTPRPPPVPPAAFRTPRPDLEKLRNQHRSQSPAKSETQAYDNLDLRRSASEETDPDAPLERKPNRDETEPGGNPILPPGNRPPPRRQ